jgi:hypothetical protein
MTQWRKWFGLAPTEDGFVAELLNGRPDAAEWVYDPAARTIRHANHGVVGVANMFLEYSSAPKQARAGLMEKYKALLSEEVRKIPGLWTLAQANLYPLVRSKYDRVTIEIDNRRSSEKVPARASKEFLQDLDLVLGYDHGPTVSQVSVDKLAEWGITFEQGLERATANLRALPAPAWIDNGDSVLKLISEAGYQESFLLLPKTFENLPIGRTALLAIPNRGVLLASSVESFAQLAAAIRKSLTESPWPLSGSVFKIDDGKIELFSTPGSEQRLRTLTNLGLSSVYNDQKKSLQAHLEAVRQDVFVASFGLFTLKDLPDDLASWCSWTEGVDSLLPQTDLIAFVRDPRNSKQTALVRWSDAADVVGHYMRDTDESPPRMRVNQFPTEDEWTALTQRAIVRT